MTILLCYNTGQTLRSELSHFKSILIRWTDSAQSLSLKFKSSPFWSQNAFLASPHTACSGNIRLFFGALFAYCWHIFTPYFPSTLGYSSPDHAFKPPPASTSFHNLSWCPVFQQSSSVAIGCATFMHLCTRLRSIPWLLALLPIIPASSTMHPIIMTKTSKGKAPRGSFSTHPTNSLGTKYI